MRVNFASADMDHALPFHASDFKMLAKISVSVISAEIDEPAEPV